MGRSSWYSALFGRCGRLLELPEASCVSAKDLLSILRGEDGDLFLDQDQFLLQRGPAVGGASGSRIAGTPQQAVGSISLVNLLDQWIGILEGILPRLRDRSQLGDLDPHPRIASQGEELLDFRCGV